MLLARERDYLGFLLHCLWGLFRIAPPWTSLYFGLLSYR